MIFNSVTLEVAIGLFLVFLMVALISSGLNEVLSAVSELRAKFLRKGIANIFSDNDVLVRSFFANPLVRGLSHKANSAPSYIPSNVFARVLRDIITPGSEALPPRTWNDVLAALQQIDNEPNPSLSSIQREIIGVLQTAGIDQAKVESLQTLTEQLLAARNALHEYSVGGVGGDTAAGQFLTQQVVVLERSVHETETAIKEALDRAQNSVETYFNEAMERVSGWYKRHTQKWIIVMAAAVTLLLNIDTLAISNTLMTSPVVRAALIEAATNQIQEGAQQSATFDDLSELNQVGIPLGWNACTAPGFLVNRLFGEDAADGCAQTLAERNSVWWGISKIVGLGVTIAAGSMGAPFWFDLLNKAVNLRLSGRKPEETPASKR